MGRFKRQEDIAGIPLCNIQGICILNIQYNIQRAFRNVTERSRSPRCFGVQHSKSSDRFRAPILARCIDRLIAVGRWRLASALPCAVPSCRLLPHSESDRCSPQPHPRCPPPCHPTYSSAFRYHGSQSERETASIGFGIRKEGKEREKKERNE